MPLAALIITNLIPLLGSVTKVTDWLANLRATAKQSGEWTDAQEQEYQDTLAALNASPQWQPE